MKELADIPSIEMERIETGKHSIKTFGFEKILGILRNKGYKIVFHPSISGLVAWKQNTTRKFINFIILNYLDYSTTEIARYKNSIRKTWNLLYEKPEALLSDVRFRTLSFPFAGKIKIPYVNNSPVSLRIHRIFFDSKSSNVKDNVFFVRDVETFSKILEEIEKPKHIVAYANFGDVWRSVVKSFVFLAFVWGFTTVAFYISLFPSISLVTTAFFLTISTFVFTVKKVKETFTEMREIFYHHEKLSPQNIQFFSSENIVKYFNLVVEAFLNEDWVKFDSLAENILNTLVISSKIDQEIHNKVNMLNEVISADVSLRNENTRFFILNELSKILKSLNILDFNLQEIFKEYSKPKTSNITGPQQTDRKQEETILEDIENKIIEEHPPKLAMSTKLDKEKEVKSFRYMIQGEHSSNSDFASEESMGVMFHPTISSIEDFLKIFNKSFEERILREGEEEG